MFVGGVVGAEHALQFGRRLIVPLPEHGQPIVQPWLNQRQLCAGKHGLLLPLTQVHV